MPNWVDNVVILDFTKASEKAKQYLERLLAYEQPEESRHEDGRPGLLGMLIPDTEAGSTNEWAYKNWGTKWDVAEFGLTQEGDKVRLCFSTANSDPHAYLTTLDREGVLVEAYAAEPGCDWAYARMGRVSHEFTNICGERERFDDFPELKDILSHYWECADEAEADEAEAEAEAAPEPTSEPAVEDLPAEAPADNPDAEAVSPETGDAETAEPAEPAPVDEPTAEAAPETEPAPEAERAPDEAAAGEGAVEAAAPAEAVAAGEALTEAEAEPAEPAVVEVWHLQRHQRPAHQRQRPRGGQGRGREAGPDQRQGERHGERPHGNRRPDQNRGQGGQGAQDGRPPRGDRPEGERRGRDEQRGPRRERFEGGRPERRDDRREDQRHAGPRPDQRPPRRERQPDPDSPFAKLAALKAQLESGGDKR